MSTRVSEPVGFTSQHRVGRRPGARGITDETVRRTVIVVGLLATAIGLRRSASVRTPFPWAGALLLLVLAAATRVFGIPLPGKGYASFAVGAGIASMIALGWAAGAAFAGIGILIGDAVFRRLPFRNAIGNLGHFTTAFAVSGITYYTLLNGRWRTSPSRRGTPGRSAC